MTTKNIRSTEEFRGTLPIRPEAVTNPFLFTGPVSEAGYEWLKGIDGKQRLVPRRVPGLGFRPCEAHPGLFREFAELKPTKDSIRDGFARQYGDLFARYEPEQGAEREDGTLAFGATLGTWTQEIGDMRVLVSLRDHIKNQELGELKKIIRRTERELSYVIETPRHKSDVILAHADIPGSGLSRFDADDVLFPARCALQMEVNKRVAEYRTVPRLTWTPDYGQRIIFEPSNLLAAIWVQFAQDITGDLRLVKCAVCGKHFQVGPGARRSDSTTCGDACRQRKSRDNRK